MCAKSLKALFSLRSKLKFFANIPVRCWINFLHHNSANIGIDINNFDDNYFIVEVQKYSDKCLEDTRKQFQNNSDNKLSFFSHICGKFELQPYLRMNESKGMAKELTKLRISAHKLKIESCRYARPKIPQHNRLCTCCNKIEDESHFLLHCTKNLNHSLSVNLHI